MRWPAGELADMLFNLLCWVIREKRGCYGLEFSRTAFVIAALRNLLFRSDGKRSDESLVARFRSILMTAVIAYSVGSSDFTW